MTAWISFALCVAFILVRKEPERGKTAPVELKEYASCSRQGCGWESLAATPEELNNSYAKHIIEGHQNGARKDLI